MKILLLGATGRTGKWVLKAALKEGHQVVCLARNVQRIPDRAGCKRIEGSPSVETDLAQALAGCDAVINVLNISRRSDFPWSRLRTPADFLSRVIAHLIPLAEKHQVSRVVLCSAWGVGDSHKDIPWWFRWFIDNSNIGVAYRDHEKQENLLAASPLNWSIIRPVGLTNSTKAQKIRESRGNVPKPRLTIGRQSLGRFMVECLEREDLHGKKVVVSKD